MSVCVPIDHFGHRMNNGLNVQRLPYKVNKMVFVKKALLLLVKNNEGDSDVYKVKCVRLIEKVNMDSEGEKCKRHLST